VQAREKRKVVTAGLRVLSIENLTTDYSLILTTKIMGVPRSTALTFPFSPASSYWRPARLRLKRQAKSGIAVAAFGLCRFGEGRSRSLLCSAARTFAMRFLSRCFVAR
jgi:hypothetical protein